VQQAVRPQPAGCRWPKSIPGLWPLEKLRFSRELRSRHRIPPVQQAVRPQPAGREEATGPIGKPLPVTVAGRVASTGFAAGIGRSLRRWPAARCIARGSPISPSPSRRSPPGRRSSPSRGSHAPWPPRPPATAAEAPGHFPPRLVSSGSPWLHPRAPWSATVRGGRRGRPTGLPAAGARAYGWPPSDRAWRVPFPCIEVWT
jgi:hypothetical protein